MEESSYTVNLPSGMGVNEYNAVIERMKEKGYTARDPFGIAVSRLWNLDATEDAEDWAETADAYLLNGVAKAFSFPLAFMGGVSKPLRTLLEKGRQRHLLSDDINDQPYFLHYVEGDEERRVEARVADITYGDPNYWGESDRPDSAFIENLESSIEEVENELFS